MSYSFLDLAYDVLKSATQPMIYQEMWQVGHDKGFKMRRIYIASYNVTIYRAGRSLTT